MKPSSLLFAVACVSLVACAPEDDSTVITDHESPGAQEPGSSDVFRGCVTADLSDARKLEVDQEVAAFMASRQTAALATAHNVSVYVHRIHAANGSGGDVTSSQVTDQ